MSALQEADNALDVFLEENDSCATCVFWTKNIVGGVCDAPEYPIGFLENDTMTCEQHEFKDNKLKKQLIMLTDKWYNAWYIVEGFLFSPPLEQDWENS
ncbi:MAG: hypothetical protein LBV17_09415 [Treponema sp.]|jgi:hypothetical protein|nr:hypothetical protein [Treponema sp.]